MINKTIILASLCFLAYFIYSALVSNLKEATFENLARNSKYSHLMECYETGRPVPRDGMKLVDVLDSDRLPRAGKTIFFHETSCPENGLLHIGPRQACSIESAAKHNPNLDIFVLFASPRYISSEFLSKEIWRLKLTYKNIFLRNNNIWKYSENSSAVEFLQSEKLFESKFLAVHMSDFLRLMSIWKFGGIYMDTDVIVKKSFEDLPLNYAGIEELPEGVDLNNGLLALEPNGYGHVIGNMFLEDFASNYDPNNWSMNGPKLVTRVMKRVCNVTDFEGVPVEQCHGFKVYSKDMFWAVSYTIAKQFFDPKKFKILEQDTRNSYSIHVFNHMTKNIKYKVGTKSLYTFTTKEQCPVTYSYLV